MNRENSPSEFQFWAANFLSGREFLRASKARSFVLETKILVHEAENKALLSSKLISEHVEKMKIALRVFEKNKAPVDDGRRNLV